MSTNNSILEQFKEFFHKRGKFEALKILGVSVLVFIVFVSIFTGYYLYQNIFSTYANLGAIASFNAIARIEVIDRQSVEETKKIKALKSEIIEIPNKLRNIFIYYETTSSSKKIK